VRAVVVDVPMDAHYGDERTMRPARARHVPARQCAEHGRRIFYNYFLRDFSVATLEVDRGAALLTASSSAPGPGRRARTPGARRCRAR
jgi:hypothetical protein